MLFPIYFWIMTSDCSSMKIIETCRAPKGSEAHAKGTGRRSTINVGVFVCCVCVTQLHRQFASCGLLMIVLSKYKWGGRVSFRGLQKLTNGHHFS